MISAARRHACPAAAGEKGLVSVILNFLNAEPFIEEAINSVRAQSYPHWELLLIDDGSTDGSTRIAEDHAARDPSRIQLLHFPHRENRGASAARNLGITSARGELIAFLDADDDWRPTRLERGVSLLRQHPQAAMVYGESEYWYSWVGSAAPHPDRVQPHGFSADRIVPAPELLIRYLTHSAAIPCPTSMLIRRAAALCCGGFVDSFRGMHDDQVFLARFCLQHDVYVARESWNRYRQHARSLCATAEREGTVAVARQSYLKWLRGFLEESGAQREAIWEALRYAERVDRYSGRGLRARAGRTMVRLVSRARMIMLMRTSASMPPP